MPFDSYHGDDLRALGRRVHQMEMTERILVSCGRCGKHKVYGNETIKHFRPDCPLIWLFDILRPTCWGIAGQQPEDCERVVMHFDGALEEIGCSDEG